MHLWHKFSKWEAVDTGPLFDRYDREVGTFLKQARICEICGWRQIKDTMMAPGADGSWRDINGVHRKSGAKVTDHSQAKVR